jgi:hypothetical protein
MNEMNLLGGAEPGDHGGITDEVAVGGLACQPDEEMAIAVHARTQ